MAATLQLLAIPMEAIAVLLKSDMTVSVENLNPFFVLFIDMH